MGPGPRVVRILSFSGLSNLTNVTWAFSLDAPYDQAGADAAAQSVGLQAWNALLGVSSDFAQPAITQFNPSVNGTIDWWIHGDAAATQTRDEFPGIGAMLTASQNPTGPDTLQTTVPTLGRAIGQQVGQAAAGVGEGAGQPASAVASFLTTAAYFAIGGVALYLAWPLLMGVRGATSAATNRAASRRSRRASQQGYGYAYANPTRRRSKTIPIANVKGEWFTVDKIDRSENYSDSHPWFIGVGNGFDVLRVVVYARDADSALEIAEERWPTWFSEEAAPEIRIFEKPTKFIPRAKRGSYDSEAVLPNGTAVRIV